jgi:hypothetical protein
MFFFFVFFLHDFERIDKMIRKLKSRVHVFGHSHMDVDRVIDGGNVLGRKQILNLNLNIFFLVRYVQHHLGSEPRHRTQSSFPHYKPKLIIDINKK